MSSFFRFVRQVVLNVVSQLAEQFSIVREQAFDPMQAMVQLVTDGAWVGKGADAFVEEVSDIMMPGVGRIGDGINRHRDNISRGIDVMDAADNQVKGIVGSLGDLFSDIY